MPQAGRLGIVPTQFTPNTPTVCRKCYIHPDIIHAYLEGVTLDTVSQRISTKLKGSLRRLRPEEAAVLALLQRRLKSSTRNSKSLKTT
jgi:DNA topoisomerase-1